MKRIVISIISAALLAAAAPQANYFGTYRGPMGEFTLEPRGAKAHIDFTIGFPGCAGALKGDGPLENNVFTLTTEVEGDDEPCTLTITFRGKKASVENENCGYFHGAACEFAGDYRQVKKGRK